MLVLWQEGTCEKNCSKHKTWFEKKSMQLSFVYYESNIAEVPDNT